MGTTELAGLNEEELGIVPRVIQFVFSEIEKRKSKAEFVVKCTFLEIYNEELHDLLDPATWMATQSMTKYMMQKNQKEITIREEKEGQISVYGLQEEKIESPQDLFSWLERGSNFRSTSATLMNACSSRSHAIFTITIEQHIIEDLYKNNEVPKDDKGNPIKQSPDEPTTREEFMVAKFHFVDLAGSERIKKTGATGTTLKEGISINQGLLCLGNVISALTDESKRVFHVPYRDSKLTRILQDSLGGNSKTTMIAWVSPAEYNYEESLNTMRYAARARNIKNKPVINRDPNSALIAQLRQNVYELQRDIIVYKKTLLSNEIDIPKDVVVSNEEVQMEFGNKDLRSHAIPSSPGKNASSGQGAALSGREIMEFEYQIRDLKIEASKKEKTIRKLEIDLDLAREEAADTGVKYFACQRERDLLKIKWERYEKIIKDGGLWDKSEMEKQEEQEENNEIKLVEEYHEKIEEYKNQADDKEKSLRNLKVENAQLAKKSEEDSNLLKDKVLLWEKLKRDLKNLEKENVKLQKKCKMTPSEVHAARMSTAREGRHRYKSQKEQRKDELKTIMKHGRRVKKHQEWLSKELGNTIENFNEMFISNLSLSLTNIFVDKDKKKIREKQDEDLNEEDEEEEEEGEHVFEVEVVEQQAKDEEKSVLVDKTVEITAEMDQTEIQDDEEEKVDPNAEQNIDEAINDNDEAKNKDKEMSDQLNEQEKAVIKIEGSLQERERLLKAVKESHSLMQNTLLEEMKKEYFKKVKEMEFEITKLKSDHKQSIKQASKGDKSTLESQYKTKLTQLELKMKHYKVKEKEQRKIEKEWMKQSNKIKVLVNDIQKMTTQKVNLDKRLREHDEKYKKWKIAKGTELINIKKMSMKKDRQISKLMREKRKNELLAQRKSAEVKVLKNKQKQVEIAKKKAENIRRKRLKAGAKKKRSVFGKKKKVQEEVPKPSEANVTVEIDMVRDWIEANVEKMVTLKHLQKDMGSLEEKRHQVEEEIEEEQRYYSDISIKKEKAVMRREKLNFEEDEGEALMIDREVEEYDTILKKNQENIESLEDKISFYDKKITNLENTIDDVNNEDIKGLNLEKVDSVQSAKTLLVAFFNIILEVKVQRMGLEDTLIEQNNTNRDLEKELRVLRESKRTMELEFNRALQKREKEYQELESKLLQETEEKIDETKIGMSTGSGLTSLEAKRLQKKKTEKNFSTEVYENSKRKLSKMMSQLEKKLVLEEKKNITMSNIVEQSKAEKEQYKQKYVSLKKKIKNDEVNQLRMNKMSMIESNNYGFTDVAGNSNTKLTDYKDLRKDRKLIKNQSINEYVGTSNKDLPSNPFVSDVSSSFLDRRPSLRGLKQTVSVEQSNSNVFDRLMSQSTITSKIKKKRPVMKDDNEPRTPTYYTRKTSMELNAELEGIEESQLLWNWDFSIENAHNGPIYSIVNLENQLYTSSKKSLKIWDIDTMVCISDIAAHSGVIKSLWVLPEQKLLAAAWDKQILLWDLVSLTNVATLKAHQDDINCLKRGQNILVSGGVSGVDSPSLFVWDLRTSSPIEERERNDVQWIEVWNNDKKVFIGNSSQLVKSIALKGGKSEALSPPHNDIVTTLCQYRGVMVSGSKDKSMRFWNPESLQLMWANESAHKSAINCMDNDEFFIYTGDKDSIVKAWQLKELSKDQMAEQASQDPSEAEQKASNDFENQPGQYRVDASSYMIGHTSQINSICSLNDEDCSLFTGGNDKSLKLWRR